MDRLTIYHTNDIHSHLTYWPRMAEFLSKAKRHSDKGDVLVFDCGDAADRTHPLAEATDGKAIIELLNEADYDAVTIGNNEGMGNTKEQLNTLYTDASFSVVLSNLFHKDTGEKPHWAKEIIIKKIGKSRKIGIIACTIPLPTSYTALGWKVEDPIETIKAMIEKYQDEVDGFIVLSHLGLKTDRKIASLFNNVLTVLGGHTHHLLPEGEKLNNTMIAGAGKFGTHIGQVTLEWNEEDHCHASAQVIDAATELHSVPYEKERTKEYVERGNTLLENQIITRLSTPLPVRKKGESDFVSLTLNAMMNLSKADGAMINSGLFLNKLPAGTLNQKHMHEALPHPMRLVTVKLTGKQLISLLHSMENQREKLSNLSVKGFGFRGKVFGDLCYENITYGNNNVYIRDARVAEENVYTIVTVDYFLYVSYFPILNHSEEIKMISPEFLRTIVADYMKQTPIV
ncbi:MAG: bifunctional metallophosphatase/5'-nucleotidase [Alkalibacterium sp.]|nr:bifunctional metallophosphatase/5'-nucleotidase [Alkalibacterium sp.]